MAETPEGVYRAAAQAYMAALPFPPDPPGRDTVDRLVGSRGFRAAVDAVWRARDGEIGQLWAERDEARESAASILNDANLIARERNAGRAALDLALAEKALTEQERRWNRDAYEQAKATIERVRTCLDEDIAWQRQAYGDGTDKVATGRLIGMEDAPRSVLAALGGANTNGRPPSTGPDGAHT